MDNGTHGQMGIMVNTEDRDGAPWGWGTWTMGHMGNGTHGKWGIVVNTEDRDEVPWGMGRMGDKVHGQWAHGHVLDHVQLP